MLEFIFELLFHIFFEGIFYYVGRGAIRIFTSSSVSSKELDEEYKESSVPGCLGFAIVVAITFVLALIVYL